MADENKTERLHMLISPSEVKAIDDWGFANRIRTKAQAVRRLCQIGLVYSAEAETIMKRNERALKALLITVDKMSEADRDSLPKGIRGGIAVAIEEQLAAYQSAVEAFIKADSLSVSIDDADVDQLAEAAREMVSLIRWQSPKDGAEPGLLDRLQGARDQRGPSEVSPSNDPVAGGARKKGGA